jgi:hypothetical protein
MRPATELSRLTYIEDGAATTTAITLQEKLDALTVRSAKCLARVTVSGGVPDLDENVSVNVTSIADDGAGLLTVTWATDFSSAAYIILVASQGVTGATGTRGGANAPTAGSAEFASRDAAGTPTDPEVYYIAAFGDQ